MRLSSLRSRVLALAIVFALLLVGALSLTTYFVIGNAMFDVAEATALDRAESAVILLDDAFQHLKLFRDLDLVLLDRQRPFGNGHLLPWGRLREPRIALQRADAVILTRSDMARPAAPDPGNAAFFSKPVFECAHVPRLAQMIDAKNRGPNPENLQDIQGKRIFAFSGLANNDAFLQTLYEFKCYIVGFADFGDHHRYTGQDLTRIVQSAKELSADILSTTEKDYARIHNILNLPMGLMVVGIDIDFRDDAFNNFIMSRLEKIKGQDI